VHLAAGLLDARVQVQHLEQRARPALSHADDEHVRQAPLGRRRDAEVGGAHLLDEALLLVLQRRGANRAFVRVHVDGRFGGVNKNLPGKQRGKFVSSVPFFGRVPHVFNEVLLLKKAIIMPVALSDSTAGGSKWFLWQLNTFSRCLILAVKWNKRFHCAFYADQQFLLYIALLFFVKQFMLNYGPFTGKKCFM